MDQKLVDVKHTRLRNINTQTYKIQEIWKKLPKSEFNKEPDEFKKLTLKGELYTKISQIYEEQEGKPIKRSTIRRCVNSLMNKAK